MLINPTIVEGQIHGGVAQGIANALYEEVVYDEAGNILTGSLADYLVPTSREIPDLKSTTAKRSPTTITGARASARAARSARRAPCSTRLSTRSVRSGSRFSRNADHPAAPLRKATKKPHDGKIEVSFTVNGALRTVSVEPRRTLGDTLREDCGLTGTHLGCEHGVCGACTVLVDDAPVRSCLMFAVQAEGTRDPHRRGPRGW